MIGWREEKWGAFCYWSSVKSGLGGGWVLKIGYAHKRRQQVTERNTHAHRLTHTHIHEHIHTYTRKYTHIHTQTHRQSHTHIQTHIPGFRGNVSIYFNPKNVFPLESPGSLAGDILLKSG